MRKNRKTIDDFYPNLLGGVGVFTALGAFDDLPWANVASADELNMIYYTHSASKFLSPVATKMLNDYTFDVYNPMVANMIHTLFINKWVHLWDTMNIEYEPLENYSMTESTHDVGTDSRNGTDTGTIANAGNGTEGGTVNESGTSGTDTGVYGFNSSSAVPSDTTDTENSSTTTRNLTNSSTNTETHNLATSDEGEHDYTITRTRSGNIGVTTSQQMAQSEIELRQYNFFMGVCEDIDTVLTLCVY
jgi:hypothetical protein